MLRDLKMAIQAAPERCISATANASVSNDIGLVALDIGKRIDPAVLLESLSSGEQRFGIGWANKVRLHALIGRKRQLAF